MYTSLSLFLAATAALVSNVAASPLVSRQSPATVPVMPGGIEDIIITAENTLKATVRLKYGRQRACLAAFQSLNMGEIC